MTPRTLLLIFGFALAVRAVVAALLFAWHGESGFLINDSLEYLGLARSGQVQDQFMPTYLVFLSLHLKLFGPSVVWPILSQLMIDSATCVVIACLASEIGRGLGRVAGLFAAINPVQIVIATLILTETLFVFASALVLWAAVRWLRAPSWVAAGAIGVAVGFGVSIRAMMAPWALALPIVLLIVALAARRIDRHVVGQSVFAALLAFALQSPVLLANHDRFGGWGLTAQGGDYALHWLVPLVMEAKDGTPHGEGARLMDERFADVVDRANHDNPFDRSRAMTRAAGEMLRELGPVPVAKAWVYGAAINLLSPAIILTTPVRELPRTGFYGTPGDSKLEKIITFLFRNDNPAYGWILLISALGTIACRAIQLRGAWCWLRAGFGGHRLMLATGLLCAAWIGFVLAINGPVASAKYRAPLEPALVVLFAIGWSRHSVIGNGFTPPPGRL